MAVPCQILTFAEKQHRANDLYITLAHGEEEIRQCQALRYQVFAKEMGAQLDGQGSLDQDHFDAYCKHLAVREKTSGRVVGTTRILLSSDIREAGLFYSQTEFDLTGVLALPGQFMEIGRTCIDPRFRRGGALGLLWQGVMSMMAIHNIDYLIGCASIPFGDTGRYAISVFDHLKQDFYAPEYLRVFPKVTVPRDPVPSTMDVVTPPLLKTYLRLGAMICGEPFWDMKFNVADLFVFLDRNALNTSYLNRFISR